MQVAAKSLSLNLPGFPIATYSHVGCYAAALRRVPSVRRYGQASGAKAYGIERTEEEWARLKVQYDNIQKYLGGKLTIVPPGTLGTPRRILELGAGTGDWASQAAREYPNAEVIAVDMAPLPPAFASPPNMKFLQLDITQGLPFEAGSFDMIHARATLMHVPEPERHLARIHHLLAPGGHLVTGDYDTRGDYAHNAPMLVEVAKRLEVQLLAKGVLPHFATKAGGILRATQAFDEITVKTVTIPFNPSRVKSDPALRAFTEALRESLVAVFPVWHDGVVTPEEHEAFLRETSQPGDDWYCEHDVVFTWSRKRLEVARGEPLADSEEWNECTC
ncbi:unnamed protein product [Peniophora sp. CBMAI 1063]|nr:unnamed protein product [Peniophora sp. CBMAI 1063]